MSNIYNLRFLGVELDLEIKDYHRSNETAEEMEEILEWMKYNKNLNDDVEVIVYECPFCNMSSDDLSDMWQYPKGDTGRILAVGEHFEWKCQKCDNDIAKTDTVPYVGLNELIDYQNTYQKQIIDFELIVQKKVYDGFDAPFRIVEYDRVNPLVDHNDNGRIEINGSRVFIDMEIENKNKDDDIEHLVLMLGPYVKSGYFIYSSDVDDTVTKIIDIRKSLLEYHETKNPILYGYEVNEAVYHIVPKMKISKELKKEIKNRYLDYKKNYEDTKHPYYLDRYYEIDLFYCLLEAELE